MATRKFVRVALLIGLIGIVALAVTVGKAQRAVRPTFTTPEECFDAYVAAREKKDEAAILACQTEAAQNFAVGRRGAELMIVLSRSPLADEIKALYEKHGIADDGPRALMILGGPQVISVGESVENKLAFMKESQVILNKFRAEQEGKEPRPAPAVRKFALAELEISEDTAKAFVTIADATRPATKAGDILFRKVNGGWLVDTPLQSKPGPKFTPDQKAAIKRWESTERPVWNLEFDRIIPVNGLVTLSPVEPGLTNADEHLAGIEAFSTLRSVNLAQTDITPKGLALLRMHPRLEVLGLGNTGVDDGVVNVLILFRSLRYIDMRGTLVTAKGAEALRRALPGCIVDTGLFFEHSQHVYLESSLNKERTTLAIAWKGHFEDLETKIRAVMDAPEIVKLVRDNRVEVIGAAAKPDEGEWAIRVYPPLSQEPKVVRGKITKDQVLAALSAAGPSRPTGNIGEDQIQEDPDAIKALKKAAVFYELNTKYQVGVVHLGSFTSEEGLTQGQPLKDEQLEFLGGLKHLRLLLLELTTIRGSGLKSIAGFKELKQVMAHDSFLSDEALPHLGTLPALEILYAPCPLITDAGVKHLGNCKSLRTLGLANTKMTDASAATIGELKQLNVLDLSGTGIADGTLAAVGQLKELTSLALGRTQVTDAGLKHLRELKNLKELYLSSTQVSDAGLEALRALSNLEQLNVERTKVSRNAVESLQSSSKKQQSVTGP
jgi:Leucine-rich repeat (LRR) protein